MNLLEFEKSFNELQSDLSQWLETEKTHVNLLIYENYQFYFIDIQNIINRIENEVQNIETIGKEIPKLEAKKDNFDMLRKYAENWTLLRLDIKSFFIFTQIFLDTLSRIIRCTYGKKGEQLPEKMTDLLTKKKALRLESQLDADFFTNLREKMFWYKDFNDKRDDIVHWLGGIRTTISRKGDLGFDILKFDIHAKEQRKEQRELWGTNTVNPTMDYVNETIDNLAEAILCIHEKSKQFRFKNK